MLLAQTGKQLVNGGRKRVVLLLVSVFHLSKKSLHRYLVQIPSRKGLLEGLRRATLGNFDQVVLGDGG